MRKGKLNLEPYEIAEIETQADDFDLALLKKASYISTKSLGTIDVLSVLRDVYEQGKTDCLKGI